MGIGNLTKNSLNADVCLFTAFDNFLSSHENLLGSEQQVSFGFKTPPNVVYFNDFRTKNLCTSYENIPEFNFSDEEIEKISQTRQEIEAGGGYDGDQLLLTGMYYNSSTNTLCLEVKKAKYALLKTLQKPEDKGGFSPQSQFYQKVFYTMGVRAPFITKDDYTFLVKRALRPEVYSAAAGHIELKGQGQINAINQITNTARKEAIEEFLVTDAPIEKEYGITSVAFRKNGNRIEIECVVPIGLNMNRSALDEMLSNNKARDAYEHVPGKQISFSLDSRDRKEATDTFELPGEERPDVRSPLIEACGRVVAGRQQPGQTFFARKIPWSTTVFRPVSSLLLPSLTHSARIFFASKPIDDDEANQVKQCSVMTRS